MIAEARHNPATRYTKGDGSIDTLAAQWIPPFHLYHFGPCRFPSTGDAGLTVAGCSF